MTASRATKASVLAAGLLGFATSCGDETSDADDSADSGAEAAPTADAADDAEGPPWCPEWPDVYWPDDYCAWSTFPAPGAPGSTELAEWNCEVPLPDLMAGGAYPNLVILAVDCELIPYADPGELSQSNDGWHYGETFPLWTAVLNDNLCESLRQTGFEEIYFLAACRPVNP